MSFAITTLTCNNRSTLIPVIQSVFRNCVLPTHREGTVWFLFLQGCTQEHVTKVQEAFRTETRGQVVLVPHPARLGDCVITGSGSFRHVTVHMMCSAINLGLSRGNNVLAEAVREFTYVLLVEDDWYCLPPTPRVPRTWLPSSLSFLDHHPDVSTVFLRRYATAQEKWQYGWTRCIPYTTHQYTNNFNYAAKMKQLAAVERRKDWEGIEFQRIPECLFTFNPCIRRNRDYYAVGVFPLPEFGDISLRRDQWTATKEGECPYWGVAEALTMEKTRALCTFNMGNGVFGHFEDFEPWLRASGHLPDASSGSPSTSSAPASALTSPLSSPSSSSSSSCSSESAGVEAGGRRRSLLRFATMIQTLVLIRCLLPFLVPVRLRPFLQTFIHFFRPMEKRLFWAGIAFWHLASFGIHVVRGHWFPTTNTMGYKQVAQSTLLMIISWLGAFRFYQWVANANIQRRTTDGDRPLQFFSPVTSIDTQLPFSPSWVYVYSLVFYVMFAVLLCVVPTTAVLLDIIFRGCVLLLVHCMIWVHWPSTLPPHLIDRKREHTRQVELGIPPTVAMFCLRLVQKHDGQNTNTVPSLHASLATLLALVLFAEFDFAWHVLFIPVLVTVSCVKTGQHMFLDCAAGSVAALVTYILL